jgi:succinate dehydrogenase / fumarate reductase cytochrome b subunit
MSNRLGNALASSVGKKIVMGLTGLLLVGFLVEHLHGNMKLVEDPTGSAFNEYVEFLQGFGWLLGAAEVGLVVLFGVHVYLAFRLTLENHQARKQGYVARGSSGGSTLASRSMFYTGALILAYLVKHLLDYRLESEFFAAPADYVAQSFTRPWNVALYVGAAFVLGIHLSHGVRSALQSLGINHPRWNPLLQRLGPLLAWLLAVGFAAIPASLALRG